MIYLIVCAMKEEQDAVLSKFQNFNLEGDIYHYKDENNEIYCVLGGIGKVSMSFFLGYFLGQHKVDYVINVGVAGTIEDRLEPFSTLVSDRCAYHDVDVTAFGYQYGQMCQCPLYFDCDKKAIDIALSLKDENIKTGLILSGDSFMTKENLNEDVISRFNHPVAIDMESVAVAQSCYMKKIPFSIIRSISDDASNDDGNKDQYEMNLNKASENAASVVKYIIDNYSR